MGVGSFDSHGELAPVYLSCFVGGREGDGVEGIEALIIGLVSDGKVDVGVGAGDGNNRRACAMSALSDNSVHLSVCLSQLWLESIHFLRRFVRWGVDTVNKVP